MIPFAQSGSAPPTFSTPDRRDSKSFDNARVTALANDTHAEDDDIEHRYGALGKTYSTNDIYYYDLISLRHESTVKILAREISLGFAISSYLNLETETEATARACIQQLPQLRAETKVIIIDALKHMLT